MELKWKDAKVVFVHVAAPRDQILTLSKYFKNPMGKQRKFSHAFVI